MQQSSQFDGGNIRVRSLDDPENIQLEIRKDSHSEYFQWFYFRLTDVSGYPCKIKIMNAGQAFVPEGWIDYNAVASYDRIHWFRVPTTFDGKVLTIKHKPEFNSVYYAYFVPYTYDQHLDLIHAAQISPRCVLESLGKTHQKRDVDLLIIGTPSKERKKIWIIARQHPGETMAEWFMEGLLDRLLDEDDPVSTKLLNKVTFYLVPNMNPDGSVLGHIRTNALGINLNREWNHPSKEKSPEVFYVLKKMEETGVDLNLDIHGDEEFPYVFVSSIEGIPAFNNSLKKFQDLFLQSWLDISPDFQVGKGYAPDEPGKANLSICSKQIGQRFGCPSFTLEMPFKDNALLPNQFTGWSPERSALLGAPLLNVILRSLNLL